MKKQLIAITIFSVLLCVGCHRQPRVYTYTVITHPTSVEGIKCATECEKMMIQKKQLANQVYMAQADYEKKHKFRYRFNSTLPSKENRDSAYSRIEREHGQCILDCGGKKEIDTVGVDPW